MTDLASIQATLTQHFPDATVREVGEAARELLHLLRGVR